MSTTGDIIAGIDLVATPDNGKRLIGGRYRPIRLLNQELSVETWLGTDLVRGDTVVIKTVPDAIFSLGARRRLQHEGEILRQLRILEIALWLDLIHEDQTIYLVMAFVPGVTLRTRLLQGSLSVRETLVLARILLTALKHVHACGVLHRNLKPASVMVNESSSLQQATLIDFGLVRSDRLDAAEREQLVETAIYMSPEQAGLLDHEVDERSDLYSAGILLYECLAGEPPFKGEFIGEVLRQHLTHTPPELRTLREGCVPRALNEVIQRLLRKDPCDRYQSAEAVLADLQAIAEELDRGVAEPAVVIGLHDRRRTLAEPAFVGRGGELAALEAQLQRSQRGMGSLVLVEAESGGGKTRLLDELAQRAARLGAWVLRGQGVDQAAQRPFQLLTGLARDLIAATSSVPQLAETFRQRLGVECEAMVAALPELADTLGSGTSELLGPESFGEKRSFQAWAALLDALGTASRPALVLLDDCQWADDPTVKLLRFHQQRWQDQHHQPNRHLMVVIAFRSEEVPKDHSLRTLQPAAQLKLPPFSTTAVRQLAESMAGPLPEEILEVIERLSEGSPFMASAVLRGLVESGALLAESSGWRVEPAALADIRSSHHAAAFLARRIELLPADAIWLLSVGAILGKEFDTGLAALLAQQSPLQAAAAIKEARRRHIVWAKREELRCVFFHDKLRETLLARLTDDERTQLHRLTALRVESQDRERIFELAYHFDAAGESDHALPYALTAAKQARTQHSLAIAEQQYRIAERCVLATDQATRYRIAEGLGDVLMLCGRYEEAAQQIESARELAEGNFAKAQIDGKLSELAFKRGDVKTATETNERALELLGHKVPQWSAGFIIQLAREAFVQVLHTLLPGFFLARKKLAGAEQQLLGARLHSRLAYCYWFGKGKIPCLWTHLRGMNIAERYPPTLELAHAYSTHAPVMSLVPAINRGILYTQKSFAICKSLGDLWGQGQALHFNGLVLSVASRFAECVEKCRAAVRLLERTGDVWEVNIAHYHISNSLYRLGDLSAAVAEASRIHRSGLELGDTQALGICLDVWVRASGGQVPSELLQTELHRPRADVQVSAQVMLAEGVRLFTLDRAEEAAALFEKGHQFTEQTGVKNAWTFPLLPWLASALRRHAEKSSNWVPGQRQALLRRASKVAKQALRLARTFQNDLPHALREAGLIAAMQGSPGRAREYLNESLAVAERQGARFEHAQTLLARGRVGLSIGWPGAAEELATAQRVLSDMGAGFALGEPPAPRPAQESVTLSLADRFDTVLDAGRRIASALSVEAVFEAVREATLKLLRGEECLVFKVVPGEAEEVTPVAGGLTVAHSRTMVRCALAEAHVVTFAEGATEDTSERMLCSGVRSALCAPIFVRGCPAGGFYVTHRQLSGLFAENEQRLAEFIATIAGAALENAAGFAELRSLNETLEERVAERSATVEARSKELARSNAELEQFAYIASHDLQEPLRKIRSFGDMLTSTSKEQLGEDGSDYIRRMQNAAERMQVLIQDLLTFSRVSSQSKPFASIDLSLIVREVLIDLETRIQETGGQVEMGALPTISGDPTQLRQLMQNLIGNALKYHQQGINPLVRICAELIPAAEQIPGLTCTPCVTCLISVQDNGIGFDEKYLDRIFLPFQRLHGRGEYEGTGMGLAVCRKIVERHGGSVTARSAPGQGATFLVKLPVYHNSVAQ